MESGAEGETKIFRTQAIQSVGGRNRLNSLSPMITPHMWVLTSALGFLLFAVAIWGFAGRIPLTVEGQGIFVRGERLDTANAPSEGLIRNMHKKNGDQVKAGDCIATICKNANSTEELAQVLASADGVVVSIEAEDWDFVTSGQTIAVIATGNITPTCIGFVSLAEGKRVRTGMLVRVAFNHGDSYGDAQAIGRVQSIDDFVTSPDRMFGRVPSETLVASIQKRFGNVTAIVVALELDPQGKAGLQWTSRLAGQSTVTSGTLCDIEIIVREIRPASLILPGFGQDAGLSP
ncbi:MAG: HlyD family efflux transporter periplasmic adaptor subunit [Planctomycetota bacterium]|nr:HlyD family efflux transporter periplasmic adaptor subunit [Planctomycetota bacterium]